MHARWLAALCLSAGVLAMLIKRARLLRLSAVSGIVFGCVGLIATGLFLWAVYNRPGALLYQGDQLSAETLAVLRDAWTPAWLRAGGIAGGSLVGNVALLLLLTRRAAAGERVLSSSQRK